MSIFLLNERRARINEIEERTDVRVIVVSDPTRSDNRFEVTRLKNNDKKNKDNASYDIRKTKDSRQEITPRGGRPLYRYVLYGLSILRSFLFISPSKLLPRA